MLLMMMLTVSFFCQALWYSSSKCDFTVLSSAFKLMDGMVSFSPWNERFDRLVWIGLLSSEALSFYSPCCSEIKAFLAAKLLSKLILPVMPASLKFF